MKPSVAAILFIAFGIWPCSPAATQRDPLGETFARFDFEAPPPVSVSRIRYGARSWQSVGLSKPRRGESVPLVVILEGAMARPYPYYWLRYRLHESGYAVANVVYDSPNTGPARALADIAGAIESLRAQSDKHGIDPNRIILLGVGSGAAFAFLLATDESYLANAGVPIGSVVGSIAVNGDGFDVPRRIATAGTFRAKMYKREFGADRGDHARFSTVRHLASPNVGAFMLLSIREADVADQAREMADALKNAGVQTQLSYLPKFIDGSVSTYFLAERGAAGSEMIDFLETVSKARPPSPRQ